MRPAEKDDRRKKSEERKYGDGRKSGEERKKGEGRKRDGRKKREHRALAARVLPGTGGLIGWLIGTAAAWVWAVAYGGQAAWFVAVCASWIVVYAVIARWGWLDKPAVTREILKAGDRMHAGEPLRVRLTIRRPRTRFPLAWLHVRDEMKTADGTIAHVHQKLLYAGASNRIVYEYTVPRLQRGVYEFGAVTIRSAEPLGIVGRAWRLDGAAGRRFSVYPQPLRKASDMWPLRPGESGDWAASVPAASSPLVSTVRDYVHGDPLQRIHWKSTARTGALKTKEPDALQNRIVTVILDVDAEAYGRGGAARARFETAASAACAVILDARRLGLAVRLKAGGAAADVSGGPAASAAAAAPDVALHRAMELLARAEPGNSAQFGRTLREEAASLAAEAPLVVITPRLDAALVDLVGMLRAKRAAVTIVCIGEGAVPNERESRHMRQLEVMGCRVSFIALREAEPGHGSQARGRKGGVVSGG